MLRHTPIIASAVVVAVLLILAGGAMVTLETRWFSSYLSDKLSKRIGERVEWRGPLHIDWSLSPTLRIEQPRINNPEWARHNLFAAADEISARFALLKLFQGVIAIDALQLAQPRAHLMKSPEFGSNWAMLSSNEAPKQKPLFTVKLRELLVGDGQLTYFEPASRTDIKASISSPHGEQLRIVGDGSLQGEPIQLSINGDPLEEIVNDNVDRAVGKPETAYALFGRLEWKDHRLLVQGTTGSVTELKQLQFDLQLTGPSARELAELAGAEAYAAPYQLQTHVQHAKQRWSLKALTGEMGETAFAGEISYASNHARPRIAADFEISAIDLDRISTGTNSASNAPNSQVHQQPPIKQLQRMLAPLRRFDAHITLAVGELQKAQMSVQQLRAEASIVDGLLTVKPLHFNIGGGQLRAQARIDASGETPTGQATVKLEAVDLGAAGFEQPGTLTGEVSAQLDSNALRVLDSTLHYWEPQSATDVEARVTSHDTPSGSAGVQVAGEGQIHGSEVQFELTSGPLLDIDSKGKPYPLRAMLTHGSTTISAEGTLTQPLRLTNADLQIRAEGPNPAQLNQLAHLNLPNLPQYALQAHLLRDDDSWYLRDIKADVGASDLAGNLRWATRTDERLMVWGDLYSQELNLDGLLGDHQQQPGVGNSGAGAKANGSRAQVLPEEDLPKHTLQWFDAHFEYKAARVIASGVPLDNIKADLTLQDGVLLLTPLSFGVGDGSVKFSLRADTNATPPAGHVDLDIARLPINELLASYDFASESFGLLGGQGEFDFSGDSLAQALASLQGQMQLIMNNGRLDATLIEALGMDGGELLFGLFASEPDPVDMQCAYAKLEANSGVAEIKALTIATADSNILGKGQINLQNEQFELVIEAHPKDFSIVSSSSPIRLYGSFSDAKVDVVSDELVARGALAAIGAAIFPPAALIPLVELGDTQGTHGCTQAVAFADAVVSQQRD